MKAAQAAQAANLLLQANGVPARWAGRRRFTVLELGFGSGHNFIATWQAWRDDPSRCERLVCVSIERHPPMREDLERAQVDGRSPLLTCQLSAAWPPLTPGLHLLRFDEDRVQLLLAFGDVQHLLPKLRLAADAVYLDGSTSAQSPDSKAAKWSPEVIKAVGRRVAADATAASASTASGLHRALLTAGFEVQTADGIGGQPAFTQARFAPRRPVSAPIPSPRTALVIGAGIAGASVAVALARQGVLVTVLDASSEAAAGASGNPAGLFHGTVHGDDGHYARLFRAAALFAARTYAAAGCAGNGVLRLADDAAAATLSAAGLPADYVRAVGASEAGAMSGVPIASAAWCFAGGGWVDARAVVLQMLSARGILLRTGAAVARIERVEDIERIDGSVPQWAALNVEGLSIAEADVLVLANAAGAAPLLAAHGHAAWPLHTLRGQLTWWKPQPAQQPHGLKLPVAGDGYAIPLPDGTLLCGATRQADDDEAQVRPADHAENLRRLHRLTGIGPAPGATLQGWVGFRLHSDDRLPIAGALPLAVMPPGQRLDQARLLPREPGLFVLSALGARGLTLAPLLGELIAAQATGGAWPLEQDLADAVDPGRWQVRAARKP